MIALRALTRSVPHERVTRSFRKSGKRPCGVGDDCLVLIYKHDRARKGAGMWMQNSRRVVRTSLRTFLELPAEVHLRRVTVGDCASSYESLVPTFHLVLLLYPIQASHTLPTHRSLFHCFLRRSHLRQQGVYCTEDGSCYFGPESSCSATHARARCSSCYPVLHGWNTQQMRIFQVVFLVDVGVARGLGRRS